MVTTLDGFAFEGSRKASERERERASERRREIKMTEEPKDCIVY